MRINWKAPFKHGSTRASQTKPLLLQRPSIYRDNGFYSGYKPHSERIEIFLVYRSMLLEQLDERRLKPSLSDPERNTPLAGATHVCRHWRQVALNCPFLWVKIALTSPESVAPLLERSRNTPLSITGKIRGKINLLSDRRMLQEVFSRSQQIRSLHLELHHGSLLVLPASQPVFAQLTALSLQTDYQTDGEVDLPPFSNSLVHFPALRELSLNMYSFGPSKRLFSSVLRKLVYESLTSCPQWTDVLFSLEGMPLLEEATFACEMEGAIPPFDPDSIVLDSINKSVALPHLRKLKLQSGAIHCGTLLAHLVVPSSVAYHLIISNDLETPGHEEIALANSDEMLAAIMPQIMKAFNGTNQPKGSRNIIAFSLALGSSDSNCHLLICQSGPTYDHTPLAKHGQVLRLEVENFWDRAVMEVVVPALSLHNVEFLQLAGRQNGTVNPPPRAHASSQSLPDHETRGRLSSPAPFSSTRRDS